MKCIKCGSEKDIVEIDDHQFYLTEQDNIGFAVSLYECEFCNIRFIAEIV